MEMAGDIVQDLFTGYLKVQDVDCECTFPLEMTKLQEIINNVD